MVPSPTPSLKTSSWPVCSGKTRWNVYRVVFPSDVRNKVWPASSEGPSPRQDVNRLLFNSAGKGGRTRTSTLILVFISPSDSWTGGRRPVIMCWSASVYCANQLDDLRQPPALQHIDQYMLSIVATTNFQNQLFCCYILLLSIFGIRWGYGLDCRISDYSRFISWNNFYTVSFQDLFMESFVQLQFSLQGT